MTIRYSFIPLPPENGVLPNDFPHLGGKYFGKAPSDVRSIDVGVSKLKPTAATDGHDLVLRSNAGMREDADTSPGLPPFGASEDKFGTLPPPF